MSDSSAGYVGEVQFGMKPMVQPCDEQNELMNKIK